MWTLRFDTLQVFGLRPGKSSKVTKWWEPVGGVYHNCKKGVRNWNWQLKDLSVTWFVAFTYSRLFFKAMVKVQLKQKSKVLILYISLLIYHIKIIFWNLTNTFCNVACWCVTRKLIISSINREEYQMSKSLKRVQVSLHILLHTFKYHTLISTINYLQQIQEALFNYYCLKINIFSWVLSKIRWEFPLLGPRAT